ncbi:hypothetical protein V5P93_003532 [Actinokineospora auranticolor]|uniref:Uncharacterized protein n=1 Tax=Actinokineospora auranticolor TaxID=155976 RepID=A0A2S6GPP2_9PSEU|nr:hypothetical protein [Actinokineospora auranticolor]PPK67194.1 hypothetical protein CLV40_108192 [Actinokineospora auranticolor]
MALTLDRIPDHESGTGRTGVLKDFKGPRRRRTVLRAIALGAATIGSATLALPRRARAETGPNALQGWDRTDCRDGYPSGYDQDPDTGGEFVNAYAACVGGAWRSSDFCEAGWHKYGTELVGDVQVDHMPVSTTCGTTSMKNAWRWTTPDGKVYRCSDGFSTYWGADQSGFTYLTICRSRV